VTKKKSKRYVLSPEVLERARAELRGETTASDQPAETASSMTAEARTRTQRAANVTVTTTRRMASAAELAEEYRFITSDLRSLLVLAAILLVVIVAIALVLPPIVG
jgi:predicted nucleic acid-binding protein